jgi:hypothetical protein
VFMWEALWFGSKLEDHVHELTLGSKALEKKCNGLSMMPASVTQGRQHSKTTPCLVSQLHVFHPMRNRQTLPHHPLYICNRVATGCPMVTSSYVILEP